MLIFSTLPFFSISIAQEVTIKTTPTTINNILINPDIGITDYCSFDIKNNPWWNQPTHPETSVVYFQWYREELESQQGQYNFKLIDNTINQATALGIPCWLKTQIDDNTIDGVCTNDNSYIVDYKNPILKKSLILLNPSRLKAKQY